eukprot:TRINITY_DN5160_c0_g1_i1.p1 TRINITY_DN5160_c0_g1~~TRINITY_DN5160_c0_g1_i1.p1  ORF type:complete len:698 (-),score=134.14 TRINITY_DN5160_c0_g1_i1:20-2113(-)
MVQHGVGNVEIDEQIALGYLQVNTGNFQNGIILFTQLLKKKPDLIAAYLGRGTAFALAGDLDSAIHDFSQAITIDANCVDAWKRRGQAKAARGLESDAISDLTQASKLHRDHEVFHQRGLVYYRLKNYKRALKDFEEATKIDHSNKLTWNHLGLCFNAIGKPKEAIEAHMKAISLDKDFKEAWTNLAQAYKDWGKYDRAEQYFTKAIAIDKAYSHAYHLRSLARFGVGDHEGALTDLTEALKIEPQHIECRHLRAVVYHGLGMIRPAIEDYNKVILAKPDHFAWYQKECALYYHHHLDISRDTYNTDHDLEPNFKESWCKRNHPNTLTGYHAQPPIDPKIPDVQYSNTTTNPEMKALIEYSREIGKLLHLNCPGYLSNARQQRFCGLAAIELAQTLKAVFKGKNEVPKNSASSTKDAHKFGWRDMYDICVKWRQYSEPNDPVWWVDLLTPAQFAEGFGSHTPMVTGQTNVVRYYPEFKRAFGIMKSLIKDQCNIPTSMMKKVEEAKDCKELYDVMRRDFWVVTPCYSTATPEKVMEGTRLTLQYSAPEGYEYSIRTPGTPPRWVDYDLELNHFFDLLLQAGAQQNPDIEQVSDLILSITFYWYNFMPLSRGTAACGYVALLGMFLTFGIKITAPVPEGMMVDWEGILRPRPEDFIGALKSWMYPSRQKISQEEFDQLPFVNQVFPTLRTMITGLNVK